MIRRTPVIALAAVAICASGCTTFSDSDTAARVDDVVLSHDDLATLTRDALGDPDATTARILPPQPGDTFQPDFGGIDAILNVFVIDAVVRADLADLGVPMPAAETAPTTYDDLRESATTAIQTWSATEPTVTEADWRAVYAGGPGESPVVCTEHILVDTQDEADDVIAELESGAEFAELAAERSIDTGSGANGGIIPCASAAYFSSTYVSEYTLAVRDAVEGDVVGPVASDFGYHVIRVRPFDELDVDAELTPLLAEPTVRFDLAAERFDIYIDPRYGTFESAARGVIPLG